MLIQNENIKNIPSLPNCNILLRLDEPLAGFFIMEFYKNKSLENLSCLDADGNLIIEAWKYIDNYDEHYQVSTFGRVKAFNFREPRILYQSITSNYCKVILHKNGYKKGLSVHRLVALAFLPNPKNKKEVNHINGINKDNMLSNLEWCTSSENSIHAFVNNLSNVHQINYERQIIVLDTVYGIFYNSMTETSELLNISMTKLFKMLNRHTANKTNLIKVGHHHKVI